MVMVDGLAAIMALALARRGAFAPGRAPGPVDLRRSRASAALPG